MKKKSQNVIALIKYMICFKNCTKSMENHGKKKCMKYTLRVVHKISQNGVLCMKNKMWHKIATKKICNVAWIIKTCM